MQRMPEERVHGSTLFSFTTATTGVIAATLHYVPVTMGHNGVLEVYMANGFAGLCK